MLSCSAAIVVARLQACRPAARKPHIPHVLFLGDGQVRAELLIRPCPRSAMGRSWYVYLTALEP